MRRRTIGELCNIIGGKPAPSEAWAFENGEVPFLRMRDLGAYHLTNNLIKVQDKLNAEYVKAKRLTPVKKGALLIPRSGSVALNHRAILGIDAIIVSHVCALEILDKALLDIEYFYYYMCTVSMENITKKTTGLDAITFEDLKQIKVTLPDLKTQKQIAAILKDADNARQQRKAANALTEQFLQSSFLHLFGDPVRNEKGWEKHSIRSLATKYSDGPFGSNLKSEHYANDGRLVIRLENIGVNQFKDSSRTYIPFEHFKKLEKHSCFPGDVIIGTMGEPNLRACILPNDFDVAINKADCVLFRPNKNLVISEYVSYLLNTPSFVKSVSNLVLGQTRGRISMGRLSTVEITVPPLPLQQHFTSLVADAEILRQKQQQSERELEHLFQALLQQYFGEKKTIAYPILESLSMAAEPEHAYKN